MFIAPLRLLILFGSVATAANSTCGTLITYRQYSKLLEGVPDCLRRGCDLNSNASLSSSCAANSPCSELWTTVLKHTGLDWCASPSCKKDIACRTHGWPIINATQLCQSVPEDWMYLSKDCCASNNEPSDIAHWITKLCTQKWRDDFNGTEGMAKEDWIEWILPWNWTVRYDNSTGEVTTPPKCNSPSKYLLLFAVDTWLTLILLIAIPYFQIVIHYSDTWKDWKKVELKWFNKQLKRIGFLVACFKILWVVCKKIIFFFPEILWKCLKAIIHLFRNGNNSNSDIEISDDAVKALLMAFFWAGLNVGATIGNTYYMKAAPGFAHTPSADLAFLWFARPSLSWATCAFGLVSRDIWMRVQAKFDATDGDPWVFDLFTGASYSAAVNELIMQILGSIYLGRTVNLGRHREFYISHHLWPFYRGRHARTMYNGALVWVIAIPVFVIFWAVTAWTFACAVIGSKKAIIKSEQWRQRQKKLWKDWLHQIWLFTVSCWKTCCFTTKPRPKKEKKKGKEQKAPHIYRPPNPFQKFLYKYVIRGWLRDWLRRHIPEGKFRKFIRRHVLRSSLGDLPQQSLSRTESIHSPHIPIQVAESSRRLPGQGHILNLEAESGVDMLSLQQPMRQGPESKPLLYGIDPIPPSQDMVTTSPYSSQPVENDAPRIQYPIPKMSSVSLTPQPDAAITSDRRNLKPMQTPQRRRYYPAARDDTYEKIPMDEGPFSDEARVSDVESARRSNAFNNPQYEYSDQSVSGISSYSRAAPTQPTQDTSYHPEPPNDPSTTPQPPPTKRHFTLKDLYWGTVCAVEKWEKYHANERKRYQENERGWKPDEQRLKWMTLAICVGMWSYVSQWMFWEGFVHTAADR